MALLSHISNVAQDNFCDTKIAFRQDNVIAALFGILGACEVANLMTSWTA